MQYRNKIYICPGYNDTRPYLWFNDNVIEWKHFPGCWPFVRGIFFDLRLNKRLSKQSRRRWFETPPRSIWRHFNELKVGHLLEAQIFQAILYVDLPIYESWLRFRTPVSDILMMASSNGNIFRVTGHLCGECTGPWWIPRTKASYAELSCFLWSASE